MEQQNQDTLRQGLFDFGQAAPWVRLPEEAKGASPREEAEREGQVILMERLARRIKDKRLLWYIRQMLKAGMMDNEGVCHKREQGTPQGGPLSPLLANLLLDELDKELEKRGLRFCRYADD